MKDDKTNEDRRLEVAPELQRLELVVPLELVEVRDEGGGQVGVVYEIGLDGLPVFDLPAQRFRLELRCAREELDHPAKVEDFAFEAARGDLAEAIGVVLLVRWLGR